MVKNNFGYVNPASLRVAIKLSATFDRPNKCSAISKERLSLSFLLTLPCKQCRAQEPEVQRAKGVIASETRPSQDA